ncbi:hypothetical protein [Roseburia sp. 1XD42-34]|nr:hypothetical protein [Roseburia sp. 1XD42-34]
MLSNEFLNNPANDVIIPKKRKTIEDIKENNIEEKYLEHEELNEFSKL